MTPPRWLNGLMSTMLRTPLLQRIVGRSTALITVTGRKSGRAITTPVSYTRVDGSIVLTCHESRQWWRNAQADPRVRLRLAGRESPGRATILRGREALPYFLAMLEDQRVVAKAHGVDVDDAGQPDPQQAAAVLTTTVVVLVTLDDTSPS